MLIQEMLLKRFQLLSNQTPAPPPPSPPAALLKRRLRLLQDFFLDTPQLRLTANRIAFHELNLSKCSKDFSVGAANYGF